ncbi:hypothetical protein GY45DRAFT_1364186 [Cubamyces sp. BRFM 1775]|nr:hypothetical protein GY45DRAFT_1364186 [Cubamyces sp. BRFM 1775]
MNAGHADILYCLPESLLEMPGGHHSLFDRIRYIPGNTLIYNDPNVVYDQYGTLNSANNPILHYQATTFGCVPANTTVSCIATHRAPVTLGPAPLSFGYIPGGNTLGSYIIDQDVYKVGNTRTSPPVIINTSAYAALMLSFSELEARLRGLLDPALVSVPPTTASERSGDVTDRRDRKFTVRVQAKGCPCNAHVKQHSEYTTGRRIRSLVPWFKPSSSKVPILKIELAFIVADVLQQYTRELEAGGTPLMFGGRLVPFEHVEITDIRRCSPGSLQPTLSILPEYRYLY